MQNPQIERGRWLAGYGRGILFTGSFLICLLFACSPPRAQDEEASRPEIASGTEIDQNALLIVPLISGSGGGVSLAEQESILEEFSGFEREEALELAALRAESADCESTRYLVSWYFPDAQYVVLDMMQPVGSEYSSDFDSTIETTRLDSEGDTVLMPGNYEITILSEGAITTRALSLHAIWSTGRSYDEYLIDVSPEGYRGARLAGNVIAELVGGSKYSNLFDRQQLLDAGAGLALTWDEKEAYRMAGTKRNVMSVHVPDSLLPVTLNNLKSSIQDMLLDMGFAPREYEPLGKGNLPWIVVTRGATYLDSILCSTNERARASADITNSTEDHRMNDLAGCRRQLGYAIRVNEECPSYKLDLLVEVVDSVAGSKYWTPVQEEADYYHSRCAIFIRNELFGRLSSQGGKL